MGDHSIFTAHDRLNALHEQANRERNRHINTMRDLRREFNAVMLELGLQGSGVSADMVLHAENLLSVEGRFTKAGLDAHEALSEIKTEVARGGGALRRARIGTKAWAVRHGVLVRFLYGAFPKDGHLLFSVGLQPRVRARTGEPLLTPDEVAVCLDYLNHIELIHSARDDAEARALAATS